MTTSQPRTISPYLDADLAAGRVRIVSMTVEFGTAWVEVEDTAGARWIYPDANYVLATGEVARDARLGRDAAPIA